MLELGAAVAGLVVGLVVGARWRRRRTVRLHVTLELGEDHPTSR